MRIGIGYDIHRLVAGRKLVLGGIEIPFRKGLLGHSDADVLLHAIMDAMLGACVLGDIGQHFPNTDKKYRNISSLLLLKKVIAMIKKERYAVLNIDATLVLEKPKLKDYFPRISATIARTIGLGPKKVSVKATTNEGLGAIGRGEGVAAYAVVLLKKNRK
jgi:2-C-methyl-D-erythritol 2,4-cyclodiphosphate synthase